MTSPERNESDNLAAADETKDIVSMESLMEHLGGFEYWPVLIDDCKEVVAKFLDYKSLTKLGMCSKADKALVAKIPYHVYGIEIADNENFQYDYCSEKFDNVAVRVQFDRNYNSGKRFQMIFSQVGEDTEMQWMKHSPKRPIPKKSRLVEKSNYYEEAVKFFEMWLERCQYKIDSLSVEMSKFPFATSKIKSFPICTRVVIGADDNATCRWWLEKVPEELESLRMVSSSENRRSFTIPTNILSLPQVMNAKYIKFECPARFTDKQFNSLKATEMIMFDVSIPDDGINRFLKTWASGKGVNGFRQVVMSSRGSKQSRVLRGIDARQWDEAFEEENKEFVEDYHQCCIAGKMFQVRSHVEPLDSLTVSFSQNCISIFATGKKASNGENRTEYTIP